MKMVKSLLLASAAGLVATAGAQAADLPVKAKAVEYVKICSLYGVGFYYIPGTDTCIRIGGHLRSEYSFWAGGTGIQNWAGNQANNDRAEDYWYNRQRVFIHTDVRTQTEYGTLRAYSVLRYEFATTSGNTFGAGSVGPVQTLGVDIGFIQWGGFLIGRAPDSAFTLPWNYASFYGPSVNLGTSDWAGGRFLTQYTYQFGNGVSGTLSLEESKPYGAQGGDRPIFNGGAALTSTGATIVGNNALLGLGAINTATLGTPGTSAYQSFVVATSLAAAVGSVGYNSGGGQRAPDIVGQLRVDQSWGTFQVAAAAHMNHALYYGALEFTGHPEDKWGGAVTAGIKLNLPTGTGDFVALGAAYSVGASGYAYNEGGGLSIANPAMLAYGSAPLGTYQTLNFGYLFDSVYGNGTALQLTTVYGGNIAFWHNWNPNWASSLNAGYVKWHYNSEANAIICNAQMGGAGATTLAGRLGTGVCNMDYQIWTLGSRTVWTPVKDFVIGAEVLASFHHSFNNGQTYTGGVADSVKPATTYWLKDNAYVGGLFSVRRYF
jgi:Porin subfamily